jgi:transcriptional regulator with XRE-family HTH domain
MLHIMDTIEIGKIIMQRRQEMRLTQQELADIANVSRRTLIELEHGRNDTRVRRLTRVLMSLGLQLDLRPESPRPTEDQLREIFKDDEA